MQRLGSSSGSFKTTTTVSSPITTVTSDPSTSQHNNNNNTHIYHRNVGSPTTHHNTLNARSSFNNNNGRASLNLITPTRNSFNINLVSTNNHNNNNNKNPPIDISAQPIYQRNQHHAVVLTRPMTPHTIPLTSQEFHQFRLHKYPTHARDRAGRTQLMQALASGISPTTFGLYLSYDFLPYQTCSFGKNVLHYVLESPKYDDKLLQLLLAKESSLSRSFPESSSTFTTISTNENTQRRASQLSNLAFFQQLNGITNTKSSFGQFNHHSDSLPIQHNSPPTLAPSTSTRPTFRASQQQNNATFGRRAESIRNPSLPHHTQHDTKPVPKVHTPLITLLIRQLPVSALKQLMAVGCDVNYPCPKGFYPLHYALLNPNLIEHFGILLRHPETSVNVQDKVGWTPLLLLLRQIPHYITNGIISMPVAIKFVEAMIQKKADLQYSLNGVSPIHLLLATPTMWPAALNVFQHLEDGSSSNNNNNININNNSNGSNSKGNKGNNNNNNIDNQPLITFTPLLPQLDLTIYDHTPTKCAPLHYLFRHPFNEQYQNTLVRILKRFFTLTGLQQPVPISSQQQPSSPSTSSNSLLRLSSPYGSDSFHDNNIINDNNSPKFLSNVGSSDGMSSFQLNNTKSNLVRGASRDQSISNTKDNSKKDDDFRESTIGLFAHLQTSQPNQYESYGSSEMLTGIKHSHQSHIQSPQNNSLYKLDLECLDRHGKTPFMYAILNQYSYTLISFLLSQPQCKRDIIDQPHGWTALHYFVAYYRNMKDFKTLLWALMEKNEWSLVRQADWRGRTALHLALLAAYTHPHLLSLHARFADHPIELTTASFDLIASPIDDLSPATTPTHSSSNHQSPHNSPHKRHHGSNVIFHRPVLSPPKSVPRPQRTMGSKMQFSDDIEPFDVNFQHNASFDAPLASPPVLPFVVNTQSSLVMKGEYDDDEDVHDSSQCVLVSEEHIIPLFSDDNIADIRHNTNNNNNNNYNNLLTFSYSSHSLNSINNTQQNISTRFNNTPLPPPSMPPGVIVGQQLQLMQTAQPSLSTSGFSQTSNTPSMNSSRKPPSTFNIHHGNQSQSSQPRSNGLDTGSAAHTYLNASQQNNNSTKQFSSSSSSSTLIKPIIPPNTQPSSNNTNNPSISTNNTSTSHRNPLVQQNIPQVVAMSRNPNIKPSKTVSIASAPSTSLAGEQSNILKYVPLQGDSRRDLITMLLKAGLKPLDVDQDKLHAFDYFRLYSNNTILPLDSTYSCDLLVELCCATNYPVHTAIEQCLPLPVMEILVDKFKFNHDLFSTSSSTTTLINPLSRNLHNPNPSTPGSNAILSTMVTTTIPESTTLRQSVTMGSPPQQINSLQSLVTSQYNTRPTIPPSAYSPNSSFTSSSHAVPSSRAAFIPHMTLQTLDENKQSALFAALLAAAETHKQPTPTTPHYFISGTYHYNFAPVVSLLIESGASVLQQGAGSRPALYYAVTLKVHIDIVRQLYDAHCAKHKDKQYQQQYNSTLIRNTTSIVVPSKTSGTVGIATVNGTPVAVKTVGTSNGNGGMIVGSRSPVLSTASLNINNNNNNNNIVRVDGPTIQNNSVAPSTSSLLNDRTSQAQLPLSVSGSSQLPQNSVQLKKFTTVWNGMDLLMLLCEAQYYTYSEKGHQLVLEIIRDPEYDLSFKGPRGNIFYQFFIDLPHFSNTQRELEILDHTEARLYSSKVTFTPHRRDVDTGYVIFTPKPIITEAPPLTRQLSSSSGSTQNTKQTLKSTPTTSPSTMKRPLSAHSTHGINILIDPNLVPIPSSSSSSSSSSLSQRHHQLAPNNVLDGGDNASMAASLLGSLSDNLSTVSQITSPLSTVSNQTNIVPPRRQLDDHEFPASTTQSGSQLPPYQLSRSRFAHLYLGNNNNNNNNNSNNNNTNNNSTGDQPLLTLPPSPSNQSQPVVTLLTPVNHIHTNIDQSDDQTTPSPKEPRQVVLKKYPTFNFSSSRAPSSPAQQQQQQQQRPPLTAEQKFAGGNGIRVNIGNNGARPVSPVGQPCNVTINRPDPNSLPSPHSSCSDSSDQPIPPSVSDHISLRSQQSQPRQLPPHLAQLGINLGSSYQSHQSHQSQPQPSTPTNCLSTPSHRQSPFISSSHGGNNPQQPSSNRLEPLSLVLNGSMSGESRSSLNSISTPTHIQISQTPSNHSVATSFRPPIKSPLGLETRQGSVASTAFFFNGLNAQNSLNPAPSPRSATAGGNNQNFFKAPTASTKLPPIPSTPSADSTTNSIPASTTALSLQTPPQPTTTTVAVNMTLPSIPSPIPLPSTPLPSTTPRRGSVAAAAALFNAQAVGQPTQQPSSPIPVLLQQPPLNQQSSNNNNTNRAITFHRRNSLAPNEQPLTVARLPSTTIDIRPTAVPPSPVLLPTLVSPTVTAAPLRDAPVRPHSRPRLFNIHTAESSTQNSNNSAHSNSTSQLQSQQQQQQQPPTPPQQQQQQQQSLQVQPTLLLQPSLQQQSSLNSSPHIHNSTLQHNSVLTTQSLPNLSPMSGKRIVFHHHNNKLNQSSNDSVDLSINDDPLLPTLAQLNTASMGTNPLTTGSPSQHTTSVTLPSSVSSSTVPSVRRFSIHHASPPTTTSQQIGQSPSPNSNPLLSPSASISTGLTLNPNALPVFGSDHNINNESPSYNGDLDDDDGQMSIFRRPRGTSISADSGRNSFSLRLGNSNPSTPSQHINLIRPPSVNIVQSNEIDIDLDNDLILDDDIAFGGIKVYIESSDDDNVNDDDDDINNDIPIVDDDDTMRSSRNSMRISFSQNRFSGNSLGIDDDDDDDELLSISHLMQEHKQAQRTAELAAHVQTGITTITEEASEEESD